eukprot:762589_1
MAEGGRRGRCEAVIKAAAICGGHPGRLIQLLDYLPNIPIEHLLDPNSIVSDFIKHVSPDVQIHEDTIKLVLFGPKPFSGIKLNDILPGTSKTVAECIQDGLIFHMSEYYNHNEEDQQSIIRARSITPLHLRAAALFGDNISPLFRNLILALTSCNRSFLPEDCRMLERVALEIKIARFRDNGEEYVDGEQLFRDFEIRRTDFDISTASEGPLDCLEVRDLWTEENFQQQILSR